jgi:hypothetical protein
MAKIVQNEGGEARDGAAETGANAAVNAASRAADTGADVVREAAERVERAIPSHEEVRRTADDASETGGEVLGLLAEQTRDGVEAAAAMRRAVRWDEVLEAQAQFLTASIRRMSRLNERYLQLICAGMQSVSLPRGH